MGAIATRRWWLAGPLLGVAILPLIECATPTDVHVTVFTDVGCDKGAQVSLVGADNVGDLAGKPPSSASTHCTPKSDGTQALGDIVLRPLKGTSETMVFELMIRPDGASADTCNLPENAGSCIVAKREVHFTSHTELEMRVDLRTSCLGVTCADPSQTCVRGQCTSALAPASCSRGCDESSLLPTAGSVSHLQRIAGGAAHTCAITATGGVKCWGDNSKGELGNGTNNPSLVPVDVKGLKSGVISLATGQKFTCALTSARTVKCWGKGDYGQLGIKTNVDSPVPVDVQNITDVTSIAAGCKHMCASTTSGHVRCWGWNDMGQIGNNTNANQTLPVDALMGGSPLTGALYVTAGFHSSCAASAAGALCWGDDGLGQLGDGKQISRSTAAPVTQLGFAPLVMWSGASHVFAGGLGPDGKSTTAMWGANPVPNVVSGPIDAVTGGDDYTCVLQSGTERCWGRNDKGQLGNGAVGARNNTPAMPVGLPVNIGWMAGGFEHGCAMTTDNRIKCWGNGANGQLGNNTTTTSPTPVDVVWP